MEEKIKRHMDDLFEEAPNTRKTMELKEEMTQNTIEKYHDLLSNNYSEEDAYQNVIRSIGDVTELFEALEEQSFLVMPEADRKKKAMLTSISVGLYIFAGVIFLCGAFISDMLPFRRMGSGLAVSWELLGLILAGLICIAPTCMLIYAANMYPAYHKREEDLVESYKRAKYSSKRDRTIRTSISCIIWSLTLCLYFLISFETGAWHITWIIFLIAGCAESILQLILSLKHK